eukprot:6174127-Pleurochrysis_carterae.AAC.1
MNLPRPPTPLVPLLLHQKLVQLLWLVHLPYHSTPQLAARPVHEVALDTRRRQAAQRERSAPGSRP